MLTTIFYSILALDQTLAAIAADEERVLLTRDVGLLKRGVVRHGAWVRAVRPREQTDEVVRVTDPQATNSAVRFYRAHLAP